MSPLMSIGQSHEYTSIRYIPGNGRRARNVSIHIIEHVPPYITMWVHLSMSGTSSSGVCGGVQKHNTHIKATQNEEMG